MGSSKWGEQKFGSSGLGISYKHDGGVNYENTWRDWKQQGLINGFGYSGAGVDQLRTTENVFVLIANPGAVSKLKRNLVTHENLIKIHSNTHFVAKGLIYEFPEGIQRPRALPAMFGQSASVAPDNSKTFANNVDLKNLANTSTIDLTNTGSSQPLSTTRHNPYANARPQKSNSFISSATTGWNGAPSWNNAQSLNGGFGSGGGSKSSSSSNSNVRFDNFETF